MAAFAVGVGAGDIRAHVRAAKNDLVDGTTKARILRDLFGPLPFGIVRIDSIWLTPAVTAVARRIYEDRSFCELPVLGAALSDAGCRDAGILGHCGESGEHFRGCWVVDLVLGRS
jgi:hypothetical protein